MSGTYTDDVSDDRTYYWKRRASRLEAASLRLIYGHITMEEFEKLISQLTSVTTPLRKRVEPHDR